MSQDDLDRNQPATPYKLQRAKERGQAAKSADVVAALVFVVAAGYMASQGFDSITAQFRFDASLLSHVGRMEPSVAMLWPLISAGLHAALSALAPLFGALMLAAVVGCLAQTGPILSFEPLKADFGRLHPMQGLRRLFSMRAPFDAVRAVVKLTLLCLVGYLSLKALAGQFYALAGSSPIGFLRMLVDDLSAVALRMAGILALIALFDLAFTRREFARKMRMSHRELKDEAKHREGDPRIRARMRELRRELRKRSQSIMRTREADVVITNPTHVAVALRYEHGRMASPQLLAKGAGQLAAAMREMAARHRIPVVCNPALARRLFRELPVDQPVPQELYAQVARIIVWVFAMRERQPVPLPEGAAK